MKGDDKVCRIIMAEIKRAYSTKHNISHYFTMIIWPILTFINVLCFYKTFSFSEKKWLVFNNSTYVYQYLAIGFFVYNCFFSLVRNALFMRHEREEGVLEMVFLTPANRMALVYGRALGALIQNASMMICFAFLMLLTLNAGTVNFAMFPVILVLVYGVACIWGGLMNTIFLFSRDSEIIFYVLDEPMLLFSGVKHPIEIFPIWGKVVSLIFPLTYILAISRKLMLKFTIMNNFNHYVIILIGYILLLVLLNKWLLEKVEKHFKEYGDLSFY